MNLLIQQKLLTDLLVPSTLPWWAGLATIDQLLTIALVLKGTDIGQKLAGRESLGLEYIPGNLFTRNCKLLEFYMHLLAPHEYKHPFWLLISKIVTSA